MIADAPTAPYTPHVAASTPAGYVVRLDGLAVPEEYAAPKPSTPTQRNRMRGFGLRYDGTEESEHTRDWDYRDSEPQILTTQYLTLLRLRSRWLARNAPSFIAAQNTICDDVIGTGFGLQAKIWLDEEETKPATKLTKVVERRWKRWVKKACIDRRESLWMLLWTAVREFVEGGEFFILRRLVATASDRENPLAVQIIPGERIDHTFDRAASVRNNSDGTQTVFNRITNGIEFDATGRRVNYHMIATNEWGQADVSKPAEIIPASRMQHVFIRMRAGQERGLPWLFGATMICHNLDDLIDSELQSAEVASQYAFAIMSQAAGKIPELQRRAEQTEDGTPIVRTKSGAVVYVEPGGDAKSIKNDRPSANIEGFSTFLLRCMGMTMGVSYERITGDFSKVNFASGRLGEIRGDQVTDRIQFYIGCLAIAPIYADWLRYEVLRGNVDIDIVDFLDDPEKYIQHALLPPSRPHHDELKGVTAASLRVLAGLSTQADEAARLSKDWEEIDEQRKRELDNKARLGIPVVTVGGASQVTGQGSEGTEPFEPGESGGNDNNKQSVSTSQALSVNLDLAFINSLMEQGRDD